MQDHVVLALSAQRAQIHAHWETLLRAERVTSPMANPDTLVFLIDSTLDEILAGLREHSAFRHRGARSTTDCPCGRNPLLAYFQAGEQVMLEALVLVQAATPGLVAADRDADLADLVSVLRGIERREIRAFCAVCQYRSDHHHHAPMPNNVVPFTPAPPVVHSLVGPCSFSR